MQLNLNGAWDLYFGPVHTDVHTPQDLSGSSLRCVPAKVPGNVELDLARAGYLPAHLVRGLNILQVRAYEDHVWWYTRTFYLSAADLKHESAWQIRFEGVDGPAEYWLNGHRLGRSFNGFIAHTIRIPIGLLRPGRNWLAVHLRPAREVAWYQEAAVLWSGGQPGTEESHEVRKPPHVYGWDIMPRAVSAGIWRDVFVETVSRWCIRRVYVATQSVEGSTARLVVSYQLELPYPLSGHEVCARFYLVSPAGEKMVALHRRVTFPHGMWTVTVDQPQLWWPRGYGEAPLYRWQFQIIVDNIVRAECDRAIGIRTVDIHYVDPTEDQEGDFALVVNHTPIYVRGVNWGPIDVFHSRDAAGYLPRLETLRELDCNLVRVWGGGVYPDDVFYEFCDRHGILVWQDFAMACALYPQTSSFIEELTAEVKSVVERFANHPSLALWCGDNEVDEYAYKLGIAPSANTITRDIIPRILCQHDPYRAYWPSSPYISPKVERSQNVADMPEQHLWGPRDYFKSVFYTSYRAAFVSEIGFMGMTFYQSLVQFLSRDAVWPPTNREWLVHATDPTVDRSSSYWVRATKTFERVKDYFGHMPDDVHEAIIASQIVQAEGYKFALEWARQGGKRGVIWWSLFDGWPQPTSDAVVDYYGQKKLAYYYIARSQRPVLVLVGEASVSNADAYPVYISNCSRTRWHGTIEVLDGDIASQDKALLWRGTEQIEAGALKKITEVPARSAPSLILLQWRAENAKITEHNHYVTGKPPYSLSCYRTWLRRILGELAYAEFSKAIGFNGKSV